MNIITCNDREMETLRKSTKQWLRVRGHTVCAWSLNGFTKVEGTDYWSTFVTLLDGEWGIHIHDDGRIERVC